VSITHYIRPQEYYVPADPKRLAPGDFCWIVTPHIDPIPRILEVERSQPEEHESVEFVLRNANRKDDFRVSNRNLPVKYLELRSHEELLCQRAKRRRGIVVASNTEVDSELHRLLLQKGKKHLHERYRFVVPCYSTQEGYGAGVPPEMTRRVECLLYRQYFYCPPNFKAHADLKEAIARFDRIQVVVESDTAAITGVGAALSEDAFALFQSALIYCLTGEQDSDLKELRDLLRETYSASVATET